MRLIDIKEVREFERDKKDSERNSKLELRAGQRDTYEMALDAIEGNVEDINDQGIAAMRKCADKLKAQLKQLQRIQAKAEKEGFDDLDFDRVESNIKHLINFYD